MTVDSEHLTHPKYRADIDGLRAIAVLSVVGFHAFPNLIRGGFIGVDIFFVISGYLISTIIFDNLKKNSFSFITFYSRRIKRIFPALLLVLATSYAIGWFLLLPAEYKQLGKHIAGGAGFISNLLFWNESGYFDNNAESKPLLHLWSLGIEEQFYIVWPLLLWLAWRKEFNFLKVTIVIAIISFVLNIAQSTVYFDSVAAFYSPQTRFWELLAGSVLAHMRLQEKTSFADSRPRLDLGFEQTANRQMPGSYGKYRRSFQSAMGASLVIIGVLVISRESAIPGWWALLPTLGAMQIISAGSDAWLNRSVLSNRVLVWFGLISYPLYLWHWPLLSFARIAGGESPSAEMRIAVVVIAIALAWLTYRFVERPIRSGKHSNWKVVVLIVLMIAVGYAGYYCYKRDGLGFRFPAIVQELLEYKRPKFDEWGKTACSLGPTQDYSVFKRCAWRDGNDKKPLLLLWGDSNAEHLYPGYISSFGGKYQITMRTASLCPPILDMEIGIRPNCKKINDYVFESIKNQRPDKIVLAAIWNEYDWRQLEGTIDQLRQAGITDIDMIGPAPRWRDNLPRLLFLKYRSDVFRQIPERMDFGLRQDVLQLDPVIFDFADQLKINYISPIKILCDEHGCITRLGETGDTLTAYDHVHLTTKGSQFLVSKFPRN
ncbi:MAG: acyltransferase family protein [Sideroxyarcus sp.]